METKILWISLVVFIKNVNKEGFSLWMQVRTDDGPLHGLWEFPGGNIESGEDAADAAVRETEEEVAFAIQKDELRMFQTLTHSFNNKTINFHVFLSRQLEQPLQGQWFDFSFKDFSTEHLSGKIPPINHQFIANIKKRIEELVLADMYEDLWQS